MRSTKKISCLAILISSTFVAQSSMASGYHFGTQSVSAQATANASAAEAADASTIFYNAAGLSKLKGTHISANLNFVMPHSRYADAEASYPNGQSVNGQRGGLITPDVVVAPHGYISHQINDRVTVGLGIYVPFGSETKYDEQSVLRYNVNQTELMTIDVNPTVAFQATPEHAFGVGIIGQYTKAKLRQYANFGGFDPRLGNGRADGYADVEGDDWGIGYNLSWLWDVTPEARIGVNYRSKIKHKLKGSAQWKAVDNAPAGTDRMMDTFGYKADEGASVEIETPESLSLHGMYQLNPRWNLFGDVTWTRHSRFDTVDIDFEHDKKISLTDSASTTRLTPKWKNSFKYAVGASYQVTKPLQLRFGIAYDQSPVPDANHRLSTIPDNDRIWFSLGAKYDLNENSSIGLAYSYLHIKSASANVNGYCGQASAAQADCVSSRTKGSARYKSYAQIVGVQYNYHF